MLFFLKDRRLKNYFIIQQHLFPLCKSYRLQMSIKQTACWTTTKNYAKYWITRRQNFKSQGRRVFIVNFISTFNNIRNGFKRWQYYGFCGYDLSIQGKMLIYASRYHASVFLYILLLDLASILLCWKMYDLKNVHFIGNVIWCGDNK